MSFDRNNQFNGDYVHSNIEPLNESVRNIKNVKELENLVNDILSDWIYNIIII